MPITIDRNGSFVRVSPGGPQASMATKTEPTLGGTTPTGDPAPGGGLPPLPAGWTTYIDKETGNLRYKGPDIAMGGGKFSNEEYDTVNHLRYHPTLDVWLYAPGMKMPETFQRTLGDGTIEYWRRTSDGDYTREATASKAEQRANQNAENGNNAAQQNADTASARLNFDKDKEAADRRREDDAAKTKADQQKLADDYNHTQDQLNRDRQTALDKAKESRDALDFDAEQKWKKRAQELNEQIQRSTEWYQGEQIKIQYRADARAEVTQRLNAQDQEFTQRQKEQQFVMDYARNPETAIAHAFVSQGLEAPTGSTLANLIGQIPKVGSVKDAMSGSPAPTTAAGPGSAAPVPPAGAAPAAAPVPAPVLGTPPVARQSQTAQQLAEWQAARTAKGENPNDMAAFRAHVVAMGFPDPGAGAAGPTLGQTAAAQAQYGTPQTPVQQVQDPKTGMWGPAPAAATGAPVLGTPQPLIQGAVAPLNYPGGAVRPEGLPAAGPPPVVPPVLGGGQAPPSIGNTTMAPSLGPVAPGAETVTQGVAGPTVEGSPTATGTKIVLPPTTPGGGQGQLTLPATKKPVTAVAATTPTPVAGGVPRKQGGLTVPEILGAQNKAGQHPVGDNPALARPLTGQAPVLGQNVYRPVNGMPVLSAQALADMTPTNRGLLNGISDLTGNPRAELEQTRQRRRATAGVSARSMVA